MALPRFLPTLLVLPALLGIWLHPGQASDVQGGCESEAASYTDIDQDDTGLIQSPFRKTVEVTKVPGIVGTAVAKGGGVAALIEAHNAPASAAASTQPRMAPATVQSLAAVHAATTASAGASQNGTAAAPSQQVEAPGNAEQMGLSFFQVGQDKGSETNSQDGTQDTALDDVSEDTPSTQDSDKNDVSQDVFDLENLLEDDNSPPLVGEGESSTATRVEDAGPGWAWQAVEMGGASLQSQLGQVLLLVTAVALVVNSMLRWHASGLPRDALSARMRKKLESMPVATGLEVRSFCAIDGGNADQLLIPGVLMRIQGRVVSKATAPLMAPLSGRSCVLYSASVSQHRHDGVHQPPVAFGSAARDFTVQLEDCPEMLLEINSQDVVTFDMEAGRYASEIAFGDAPDSWRGFMLDNLTPGVEGCGAKGQLMNRVDLNAKGALNFRECALVIGSRVTCIGEVVREHNGKLRLSPWSPPPLQDALGEPIKSKTRAWRTPEADPWLHKLMISDDSRLPVEASPLPLPGKCRSCTGYN